MEETSALLSVAEKFALEGKILSLCPYGEGHINRTFLLTTDKKRYILQKMNTLVFKDPCGLMKNICAVTSYLKARGRETLEVVPLKSGESFLFGEECFRVYKFIEDTVALQSTGEESVFEEVGRAFGAFQRDLCGFDASTLCEVIPHFHDTPKRFRDFAEATEKDTAERRHSCEAEIRFVWERKDTFSSVTEGLADGSVPCRVTHNDTKLNNILLDARTEKARAIIDLDTIMPGSLLYDFGDAIRFGASTAAEDEPDLDKVHFDVARFSAYARGFFGALGDGVTGKELSLAPYSAYLMTMECGMRFLADYLSGDTYFATRYPTHNLVRARTQFRLAREMEERFPQTEKIIADILN